MNDIMKPMQAATWRQQQQTLCYVVKQRTSNNGLLYQESCLSSCQQQSTVWDDKTDRIGAYSRLFCIVHQKDISFAETYAKKHLYSRQLMPQSSMSTPNVTLENRVSAMANTIELTLQCSCLTEDASISYNWPPNFCRLHPYLRKHKCWNFGEIVSNNTQDIVLTKSKSGKVARNAPSFAVQCGHCP